MADNIVLNDYEKLTDKSKKSLAIMIHALAIEEEKEENAQHTV